MNQFNFGSTELKVTSIGLGLAALGRPGYINLGHSKDLKSKTREAMKVQAHKALDVAYDAGVRYFDAARSYGLAESFLGEWLNIRQPKDVVIGSKWGYTYTADWQIEAPVHEVKEHTLRNLNKQWDETNEELGAWLDLYQIHSATLESGVLEDTQVLHRLAQLKSERVLIGLSTSGPHQSDTLEKAGEIEIDGVKLFNAVQVTFNLLETSTTHALKALHDAGVGVIVKEALANGRLTSRSLEPDIDRCFNRLTQDRSWDAVALAFVLSKPFVDVVLSGASIEGHLLSNIASLQIDWQPEWEECFWSVREQPELYWEKRKALAWN